MGTRYIDVHSPDASLEDVNKDMDALGGEQVLVITADAKIAFCVAFGHNWKFEKSEYGDGGLSIIICERCGIDARTGI